MSNLFSTFDPVSWFGLSLNWTSALIILVFFPAQFWLGPTPAKIMVSNILGMVAKEFKSIMAPAAPGVFLLPLTLFIFILLNNAIGLLPYIFTASSHLSFTLTLALPLWCGHMILAIWRTPTTILAHLVPLGTPPALMPLMVVIEMVSSIIRPLTLAVRLAANMIAGHLLLTLLGANAPALTLAPLSGLLIGLILLATLECAVSMIQAYVFSVLSTLYLNEVNSPSLS